MRIFLDSSILIEYVKGNRTELFDLILKHSAEKHINHIIFSEFIFHFISLMSGKSPLTIKNSKDIGRIIEEYKPGDFINLIW